MPTRYSLRTRPIYDDNEPTTEQSIANVISQFAAKAAQSQEEDRAWENEVRAAGGTFTPAPSFGDNVRRVGRGIAGIFGHHGPSITPDQVRQGMVDRQVQPTRLPVGVTPMTTNGATMGPNGQWQIGGSTQPPGTMSMLGDRNPNNQNDSDFIIQKGPHGQIARVPKWNPLASNRELATLRYKDMLDRSKYEFEQGIAHKNRLEEIAATPRSASVDPEEWNRRQAIIHGYDMSEINARESAADRRARLGQEGRNADDDRAAKNARRMELTSIIQGARALIPTDPADLRRAMNDPQQAQTIRAARVTVQQANDELNKLAGLPSGSDIEMNARRQTATPQTMQMRVNFLTAEARRRYPKASKEQISRAVRRAMIDEGWPIQ